MRLQTLALPLVLAILAQPAPAEDVRPLGPFVGPDRPTARFWEPDNSDIEMKFYLLTEIRPTMRCARKGVICDGLHRRMLAGGDRFGNYLLRQYEEAQKPGFVGGAHYLRMASYTRSDRVRSYVRETVLSGSGQRRIDALGAMGFSLDPAMVDLASDLLETNPDQTAVRAAILAVDVGYRFVDEIDLAAISKMQEIERDQGRMFQVRREAFRTLNKLEKAGLAQTRAAPEELIADAARREARD